MRVDVSTGLMVGVKQVLSPFFDERPAGVVPDLIVLHGISLPPGEFGGPWIARLFTGNLPADAHPEFRERAALASLDAPVDPPRRRGRAVRVVQRSRLARGKSRGRAAKPATTIPLASSARARTNCRTSRRNTQTLRTLLPMLLEAYPPSLASGSSATATLPRAARRIRGRHSTGRGYAESGICGGFHDQEIVARIVGLPVHRIGTGCRRLPG